MNKINQKILKTKKAMNAEIYKSNKDEIDKALAFFKEQDRKIKEEKLRKGLYRNKDNILEIKIRTYVKDENRIREIFKDLDFVPKNKVYDAKGKKKEYQHSYPTKSQWDWKHGEVKPENYKENEIQIPVKRKIIFLYDGENVGIYEAEISGQEPERFSTVVWKDGCKINSSLYLERWDRKENLDKKIRYKGLKMTIKDLVKTEIHLGIPIYKILEIDNIIIH